MKTVTLQVPMSKKLRDSATKAAKREGFSSLQEFFRVLATKLSQNRVSIDLTGAEYLSSAAEKRFAGMDKDFKEGKNTKSFDNVDDLMKDLTS